MTFSLPASPKDSDLSVNEAINSLAEKVLKDSQPQVVHFDCEANVALFMTSLAERLKAGLVTMDAGDISDCEERGYPEDHPLWVLADQEPTHTVILHLRGLHDLDKERMEGIRQLITYKTIGGVSKSLSKNIKIVVTSDHALLELPWDYQIRLGDPISVRLDEGEGNFKDPAFAGKLSTYQGLQARLTEEGGDAERQILGELKDIVFGPGARLPAGLEISPAEPVQVNTPLPKVETRIVKKKSVIKNKKLQR